MKASQRLRWLLVVLIFIGIGVWLYVGPLAPEPQLQLNQHPRARQITPRSFTFWALYADDTARIIEFVTECRKPNTGTLLYGPSLNSKHAIVSFELLGGQLSQQPVWREETYGGKVYLRPHYVLDVDSEQYGYDIQVQHPPHLHVKGNYRLFSLGIDPSSYYAQEIIAVALPVAARIKNIYDYQPYRHITLDDWDVYFYDTTNIKQHISIHIYYRPTGESLPLDWQKIEMQR